MRASTAFLKEAMDAKPFEAPELPHRDCHRNSVAQAWTAWTEAPADMSENGVKSVLHGRPCNGVDIRETMI